MGIGPFRSQREVARPLKVSKARAGHFAKAGVPAGEGLWEFRLDGWDEAFEIGAELTVGRFEQGQKVDVAGQSKGKGFQGAVKRWNFSTAGRHPR